MGTIAEKLTYLEGTKSAIKDAIIAKGVDVTDTDTFRSYAEKIESIEAGGSCESQSKEITITDNGTRVVTPDEGYLLDQVTVTTNVIAGKPELPNGISFEGSTWTTFDTDPYDWSQIYSGTNLFRNCTKLNQIYGTAIESVYFLDFYQMFTSCTSLKSLPLLQGKPTSLNQCFNQCRSLENPNLSKVDFSDVVDIHSAFSGCKEWAQDVDLSEAPIKIAGSAYSGSSISSLPRINYSLIENASAMFDGVNISKIELHLPNAIDVQYMFRDSLVEEINLTGMKYVENISGIASGCKNLQKVSSINCGSVTSVSTPFLNCNKLTDFGGFINLGESFTSRITVYFNSNSLFTKESALNIINGVYDFVGNGSTLSSTLQFHTNTIALLSEEDIAIATAKG